MVISTALPLLDGFEAFCFGAFSALGLRTSFFVFFGLLARAAFLRVWCPLALYTFPPRRALLNRGRQAGVGSADSADHGILAEDQKRGRRKRGDANGNAAGHDVSLGYLGV